MSTMAKMLRDITPIKALLLLVNPPMCLQKKNITKNSHINCITEVIRPSHIANSFNGSSSYMKKYKKRKREPLIIPIQKII